MLAHTRGKFHQHSICGSQVTYFQMFSWQCSIHQMAPFWEFPGLFSPKYHLNQLKVGPEVFHHKKKTVYKHCFKTKCLGTNRMHPKFTVLVHFWARFILGKRKILPKAKKFSETTFFGLSNDTIPHNLTQVSDKSQNSHKNYQKDLFFGPKCPLGPSQQVKTNFHIAYNRPIHPWFLNAQLLTSGCLSFSTLPGRYPYFFELEIQLGPILGFWGNNSSK